MQIFDFCRNVAICGASLEVDGSACAYRDNARAMSRWEAAASIHCENRVERGAPTCDLILEVCLVRSRHPSNASVCADVIHATFVNRERENVLIARGKRYVRWGANEIIR